MSSSPSNLAGTPSSAGLRSLAQEVVSWYLDRIDPMDSHAENVQNYLRGPVTALTIALLQRAKKDASTGSSKDTPTKTLDVPPVSPRISRESSGISDWREYLQLEANTSLEEFFTSEKIMKQFESLSPRSKARMEAHLDGVSLAVESDKQPEQKASKESLQRKQSVESNESFSLIEGLIGFTTLDSRISKPHLNKQNSARRRSNSTAATQRRRQIDETDLVTRLELYLRTLHRVVTHNNECVIAHEPAKALKARARAIVSAFINTAGTIQHVTPVLTRLLTSLSKELLAFPTISEDLNNVIHSIVSNYVHATSFASLAFLSSPETSADQRLTPAILNYILFLQKNWKKCVSDCEIELMLSTILSREMRMVFKNAEFASIGQLLDVCRAYRDELTSIELAPRGDSDVFNDNKMEQAYKDVQREVIAVNGSVLPRVTNREHFVELMSAALNSRNVFEGGNLRRSKKKKKYRKHVRAGGATSEESDAFFSGNEADFSETSAFSGTSASETEKGTDASSRRRSSKFKLSTLDMLTKRVLLAASRTGTGGDAYFVVRDLFGGEDVEVVPSEHQSGDVRPPTIDIVVRLASVTIKCHGSFDVYPKSMVGDCEPLIQLHTTTSETVALQEVRATDPQQQQSSKDGDHFVTVLQERKTDKSGYRMLSVRPALYEKVSVWHTPS